METIITKTQTQTKTQTKTCRVCGKVITGKSGLCRTHSDEQRYAGSATAARNAEILRMVENGIKPGAIADQLQVSRQTISAIIRREQKRQGKPIMGVPHYNGFIPAASCQPELKARLDAYAQERGASLSAVIRQAVQEFLDRQ